MCDDAVSNNVAAVDVNLRDAKTRRLVARARYTEQTPHGIRAKASTYLHNAATAARAVVQRLQQGAESISHKAEQILFEDDADEGHAEHAVVNAKSTAYVESATASVKAAAQRLQHAAETVLRSSPDAPTHSSNAEVACVAHAICISTCLALRWVVNDN